MRAFALLVSASLAGCPEVDGGESPRDWYDRGSDYDVQEPVAFTDVPYTFEGATGIADLPEPPLFTTIFASDDVPGGDCDGWTTTEELPVEITGIVTIHPRFYYKSQGCSPGQPIDSDEKFYGSYFVQDASGGYFVLGDSKVAHFDMGDRVTLRVRALRESFGSTMIAAHDVVEIERGPEPIYYQSVTGPLGFEHVAEVVRVEGTVATEMSTFGEVYFDSDQGVRYKMGIDSELSRRGVGFDVGTRIQVTGPVLYSFSEFTVVVMRVGQLTEL
jgi:hypothetical protein